MWVPDVYHRRAHRRDAVPVDRAEDRVVRVRVPPAGARHGQRRRARGRRCSRRSRCCRWCSATSSPSRRAISSACSRTRPSATWASSCSASWRASEAGYEAALYYTVAYVLMTLGSFGVLVLASRAGFRSRGTRSLQGTAQARSAARARDAGADVLHRRRAAVHRLLGEVQHLPGAVAHRPLLADPDRRRGCRWSACSITCAS